jgi:hypothetical protein
MCEPCGDPTHHGRPGTAPELDEDEDDDPDHECPWCGEPCTCPGGAAEPGPGEPLDCTHDCDDAHAEDGEE